WPPNRHTAQALIPKTEMQPPIVLTAEAAAAVHHLALAPRADFRRHLRADRAAIAPRPHELELEPAAGPHPLTPSPFGRGGTHVLVQQRSALLIRDHDVEQPAIEEIGHRDRASVQPVRDARLLC